MKFINYIMYHRNVRSDKTVGHKNIYTSVRIACGQQSVVRNNSVALV